MLLNNLFINNNMKYNIFFYEIKVILEYITNYS